MSDKINDKNIVDEMCIVVYEWEGFSTYDEVLKIVKQFPTATIVKRATKIRFRIMRILSLNLDRTNNYYKGTGIITGR